ncbi:MAG: hypothetical protein KGL95_03185 [Patescibacteria group bacterium]|nr:hypothetical protein [Patescibacteria group bacterium]
MKIRQMKNLTKTTTIIGTLVIGLIMLSPMTVLPNVNAQQNKNSEPQLPPAAAELESTLAQQIHIHPGWIYMMSWDSQTATVNYLGPADSNPYKAKMYMQPTSTLAKGIGIKQDSTSGSTAEYKEVSDFKSIASNTNSNLLQIVNAMNSNSQHWLQAGLFYDNGQIYGSPAWRMQYDSIQTGGCFTGDFNSVSVPQTVNAGDNMEEFIKADGTQPGVYSMGENDLSNNHGTVFGFSESNDSGKTINLGDIVVGSCNYSSGPMEEEQSAAFFPTNFNWGSQAFTMGFYDTPTSGKTTNITGWFTPWGNSCISLSPNPPPTTPAVATFVATSC